MCIRDRSGWGGPNQLCNDWSSDNTCTPGESLTLPSDGEYAVVVQGQDNCNTVFVDVIDCMASPSSAIFQNEETPFKITELFPNPATNQIVVELRSDELRDIQIGIMDAQGRTMLKSSKVVQAGANNLVFNIQDLPAGIYYLHVEGFNGKKEALKFVKIKM